MLQRLAQLLTTYPRLILLFWILLVAGALPLGARIGEVVTADSGTAPDSIANEVARIIREEFASGNTEQLLLIAEPRHQGQDEAKRAFNAVVDELREHPGVESVIDHRRNAGLPLVTEDGNYIAILNLTVTTLPEARVIAEEIEALLPENEAQSYLLSGNAAIDLELRAISSSDARRAEMYGLPLSLIVLSVAFGALVAAGLPLLVAVGSIILSLAVLYLIGQVLLVATFAQIVVSMLGLATGIDYALFMVNRYREELRRGHEVTQAVQTTVTTAGRAVLASGSTVMVALAALLVPPLAFIQSIGLSGVIVMFFSVSLSTTALPAALTLLGGRVNLLRLTRRSPGDRSRRFWRARATSITAHPLPWATVGVTLLLLLGAPATTMQVSVSAHRGLSEETTVGRVLGILERADLSGLLRSFDILVDFEERGFYHPSSVRAVSRFNREAAALPGVEQVIAPTSTVLPSLLVQQYYATPEVAAESPLEPLRRLTVSEDGRYALLRVFPHGDLLPAERDRLESALAGIRQTLGVNATIGGRHVAEADWRGTLYSSFPLAIALVYLVTFILLALTFQSLVIPLKAILLNTLTVGAAFGAVTLIFQHGFLVTLFGLPEGLGFVDTSVPFFIFAIVFGISMDYEVFLMSRITEGHRRGLSDREAVIHALESTGSVITSAALIMFIVFSAFVFSDIILIKSLSVGLSIAIFLDGAFVRLFLLPTITLLAGRWNWWLPGRLRRYVKQADLSHD